MRKLTGAIALLCLFAVGQASAQQPVNSLKGTVSDTLNKQDLYKAVVSVLRVKDSMLVKFARTDVKGRFEIKDIPAGKYILLTSFPNYADYIDFITMTDNNTVNIASISMITKAHLLEEVVVKQNKSIRLKGDTTEYNADSFKVQPNATVEELLKQLPGIQVDKDGKITAQGQTVQKVLVDGEEFFGDDPTLVTQNIRADMVAKVQVFDKKSDQAAFTGIDDGQKTKTINLKLKDDKKRGYFGKIDAGTATNDFYNAQLMFNKFQKKEKLSVYGILSNTGKLGLNWQDQRSYGDNSSDIQFDDNGNGYYTSAGDDLENWSGSYSGQGYPKVQTGGAHYNNKLGDDRQTINGNYKVMDLAVNGANNTNTQYILPDTSYFNTQKQVFNNRITRNKANVTYNMDFDTTSSLKVMADTRFDHKITNNSYSTQALAQDSSLVNQGNRQINTVSDISAFNSSILWRKKLKKKGRTISINAKENYNITNSSGFLNAANYFYKGSVPLASQVTDQYKVSANRQLALDSKITYTEPLSAAASLVFNYGVTLNNSTSNRNSFNRSAGGKYDVLDTTYSNDYKFNILTQKAGASFAYVKKKYSFTVGNTTGYTNYAQTDLKTGITGRRDFVNWFPQAYTDYSFTTQRRMWLRYNGSTSQPSLQQIQPLRTNDDPLNIIIGNALLKPSFRNNMSFGFNDYKALSGIDIYSYINYSTTDNAFASRDFVDSVGRRVSQAINVNGNNSLSGYFSYGFPLFKAHTNVNLNVSNSRYVNEINGQRNVTESQNYSLGASAGRTVDKLYANSISSNITYTTSTSSVQQNAGIHYWTYNIRPDLDFYLPLKIQIHTDIDFIFRGKTNAFDKNNNVVFWNAWIGKKLLAGDALVIKLSGNDILNQNIGFTRSVNTNYITENTYSTIQRYFMISAVWSFAKGAKAQPTN